MFAVLLVSWDVDLFDVVHGRPGGGSMALLRIHPQLKGYDQEQHEMGAGAVG